MLGHTYARGSAKLPPLATIGRRSAAAGIDPVGVPTTRHARSGVRMTYLVMAVVIAKALLRPILQKKGGSTSATNSRHRDTHSPSREDSSRKSIFAVAFPIR